MTNEKQILSPDLSAPFWKLGGEMTYVYFVTADEGNAIKIGKANNPYERLKGMQSANHLDLFLDYSFSTEPASEALFHKRFKNYQIRGEWYQKDKVYGDLEAFTDNLQMMFLLCGNTHSRPVAAGLVGALLDTLCDEWTEPGGNADRVFFDKFGFTISRLLMGSDE